MTAAYYYADGAAIPADGITLSKNMEQANGVLYETHGLGSWRYAFMVPSVGLTQFVDCAATPKDGLCRAGDVGNK